MRASPPACTSAPRASSATWPRSSTSSACRRTATTTAGSWPSSPSSGPRRDPSAGRGHGRRMNAGQPPPGGNGPATSGYASFLRVRGWPVWGTEPALERDYGDHHCPQDGGVDGVPESLLGRGHLRGAQDHQEAGG